MEEDVKNIGDYLSIAWRRKFLILIPFIIVLIITVLTVYSLPATYRSTGTILIESQQIPQELIQSTVTSFADERIQIIKQRIMTSQQIFSIIKKFNLYQGEFQTTARSDILEDMRDRILIERVNANLQSRGRGAIIAFTVGFEHQSPAVTQKVANELVTLFLNENIKSRTARAAETTSFLGKESDRLRAQIEVMEEQIATYKQDNKGSLPENLTINLQRIEALKVLLFSTERELNTAKEMKIILSIELDNAGKGLETSSSNSSQLSPKAELRQMQNQYVSLSARYGADHPDVKAIIRQIRAFEEEFGSLGDKSDLVEQVNQVKSEMAQLTKKYSSEHPDVKRLRRKLDGLESMLDEYEDNPAIKNEVDNQSPEYLQAKARLDSAKNNIKALEKSRLVLEKQIAQLDIYINQTPQVERGLEALKRDYKNIESKYQEIKNKQLQAELAMSLEEDQKGERFTLLEPPLFPDKPVKPDRPKLFMLGLMLSIFSGLGVAGLAEVLDGGIRGSLALASVTKTRPLVVIPYISTQHDANVRKRNLKLLIGASIVLGIVSLALVHFYYKPLDLLWVILLRKLNLA